MNRSRVARSAISCVVVATATLAVGAAAGCYSRVVKETGLGRGSKQIYEPNVEEPSDTDQWNLSGSSSNPGVKNWKSAGQKPKPKPAVQD